MSHLVQYRRIDGKLTVHHTGSIANKPGYKVHKQSNASPTKLCTDHENIQKAFDSLFVISNSAHDNTFEINARVNIAGFNVNVISRFKHMQVHTRQIVPEPRILQINTISKTNETGGLFTDPFV